MLNITLNKLDYHKLQRFDWNWINLSDPHLLINNKTINGDYHTIMFILITKNDEYDRIMMHNITITTNKTYIISLLVNGYQLHT